MAKLTPVEQSALPPALGIRHVALKVRDLEAAERFYASILGYRVEWRPDPDNLYLSLGPDNLALHRDASASAAGSPLDHFGVLLRRPADVDAWADHLKRHGVALRAEPKTHRDGARSFYASDPEGNVIQFLYHPPISDPPSRRPPTQSPMSGGTLALRARPRRRGGS